MSDWSYVNKPPSILKPEVYVCDKWSRFPGERWRDHTKAEKRQCVDRNLPIHYQLDCVQVGSFPHNMNSRYPTWTFKETCQTHSQSFPYSCCFFFKSPGSPGILSLSFTSSLTSAVSVRSRQPLIHHQLSAQESKDSLLLTHLHTGCKCIDKKKNWRHFGDANFFPNSRLFLLSLSAAQSWLYIDLFPLFLLN